MNSWKRKLLLKIVHFFTDCFAVLKKNERVCWFQPDGATAHTATTTTASLHYFFCDGIVGRRLWLTRFPDIMPDAFFLWGFFKEGVYSNRLSSRGLVDLYNI